jgi:hypothetical protein
MPGTAFFALPAGVTVPMPAFFERELACCLGDEFIVGLVAAGWRVDTVSSLIALGNQVGILGDQLIAFQHRARQDGQPAGDFLLLGIDLRKAVAGTRKHLIFHCAVRS